MREESPYHPESERTPAALVNPKTQAVFTFSFSSGKHPHIRRALDLIERILSRTLYRPFMRFLPAAVEHVDVPLATLPVPLHGLTIAHLSDIHHSQVVPLEIVEQVVVLTNHLGPQVVVLTGDFVTNDAGYAANCARVLGRLQAPLGVYAILGNHDYWADPAEVTRRLRENGVIVLINEARRLTDDLWLVGLDDIWSGQPDLEKAMDAVPSGATTMVLAHEPDVADRLCGKGVAVQLSGHSHGGQVRVPFTDRPVLPFLSWKYYAGLSRVCDLWVYTNPGIGTMQPPFIFTCRPRVALLRFVPMT